MQSLFIELIQSKAAMINLSVSYKETFFSTPFHWNKELCTSWWICATAKENVFVLIEKAADNILYENVVLLIMSLGCYST